MERPLCFKCKNGIATVSSRDGPKRAYCTPCFERCMTELFRTAFHRHCRVPPAQSVLLCLSGGTNSMALLDLVAELHSNLSSKDPRANVAFEVTCLHIEEDPSVRDLVSAATKDRGFRLAVVKRHEISRGKDLSDTEEIARLQLRAQIIDYARSVQVTHCLVGFNGTEVAIEALNTLVHGRGRLVCSDGGYSASAEGGQVVLHRPLRDMLASEVALYAHYRKVPSKVIPLPSTGTAQNTSLRRITATFIHSLQSGFRSTVFNVLQTIGKIEAGPQDGNSQSFCVACAVAPLPNGGRTLCDVCLRLYQRTVIASGDSPVPETLVRRVGQEEQRDLVKDYLL